MMGNLTGRKFWIVLLLLIPALQAHPQDTTARNSVCLMVVPAVPALTFASVSYERFFSDRNSVGMTVKYAGMFSEDLYGEVTESYLSLIPSYRHYFGRPARKPFCTWISGSAHIMMYTYDKISKGPFGNTEYATGETDIGAGMTAGVRLHVGKKRRLFADAGGGVVFFIMYEENGPIYPRGICMIGYRF